MDEKNTEKKEKEPVIPTKELPCDRQQALRAIHLLEKGTKQAFLDGELSAKDTDAILGRTKEAKQYCEAGDANACAVVGDLMARLTQNVSERASEF